MVISRPFPIFFAPDTDTVGTPPPTQVADVGTSEISVPVVQAPERRVQEVTLPGQELEQAPILKDLPKETRKIRGPQDFGMESAEESSERMELTPKRERGPDGKFIPKGPKQPESSPNSQPPKPKAPTPVVVKAPVTQPAKPAESAPVAKVKIGNEEKTAEEWAAHFKELQEKAGAPAPPNGWKAPEPAAKTAEETAAEAAAQKERETKFVTERAKEYTMPAAELDEILVGGEAGAAKLGTLLARAEMRGRQHAADQVNKLAEHYDNLLAPILTQNQTVQGLMQETAFLGAHPDIKSHPEGAKTFREMKSTMESGRQVIAEKIAAGTASRREQLWAEEYDETPQEKLLDDLAGHTRAKLATLPAPAAPAPPKPAAPKPPAPPTVVEKPLGGDRPGGNAVVHNAETIDQQMARESAQRAR